MREPAAAGTSTLASPSIGPGPGSWWVPPPALPDGGEFRATVSRAAHRDRAALRLPPLAQLDPVPAAVRPFARRMSHIGIQIEDIGGAAAEALLAACTDVSLRGALKRAVWDEVRHSDLLAELDDTLADEPAPDVRPVGTEVVHATLGQASSALEFAVAHLLLEAQASDVFRIVVRTQRRNVLGRVFSVILADEMWHVELGLAVVAHFAAIDPAAGEPLRRVVEAVRATAPQRSEEALATFAAHLGLEAEVLGTFFARQDALHLRQLEAALGRPLPPSGERR